MGEIAEQWGNFIDHMQVMGACRRTNAVVYPSPSYLIHASAQLVPEEQKTQRKRVLKYPWSENHPGTKHSITETEQFNL